MGALIVLWSLCHLNKCYGMAEMEVLTDKERIRNSQRPKIKEIFAVFENLEERMEMLCSLGWKKNQYLPENWLCREADRNRVSLLTSTGESLESYRATVEHLEQNSRYTQKDVDRFLLYPDSMSNAAVQRRAKFISARVNDEIFGGERS